MKFFLKSTLFFLIILFSSCGNDIEQTGRLKPKNGMDSISYIIGYDHGEGIRNQGINANPAMVYKGLADALANRKSIFDDTVQSRLIDSFQRVIETREQEQFLNTLQKTKTEGRQFLEQNRKNSDVVVLPSGLQYKIVKIGKGDFPNPSDSVTIHYRAMFINRTTFDMSYDSGPVGVRLNKLVKGLSEGIQLMKPGAIFEFYIPPHLAYGDNNYLDLIPAGSTIINVVELISIHP
jgi:FKBP-type peptidyl-prolyl cis-trans isomerase